MWLICVCIFFFPYYRINSETMLNIHNVNLFIWFCISCAARDCLPDLNNKSLLCLLEECLLMATYFRHIKAIILLYQMLGDAYYESGDYNKAIEYNEKSLRVAKRIGNRSWEGMSYRNIGYAYHVLGEYHKAMEYSEKSLGIAKEIGDRAEEVLSYGNLGNACRSLGQCHKAIAYHEKSLRIAIEINDIPGKGQAYRNIGNIYQVLGEYRKAILHHEKSLNIAKKIGNRVAEGSCYGNLGNAYYAIGECKTAIEYHEKFLCIAKDFDDTTGEGRTYGNLGLAYCSLGEYHKAIEYHEKSLAIEKEIGGRAAEGITYMNLGICYQSLGNYNKATEYHEKSLAIAKEIGNKAAEGRCYINLGFAFKLSGDFPKAIAYNEKSLGIAKEIGDRAAEGGSYGSLGIIYQSLGNYLKATEYLEKGLSISKEIGDREGEGGSYLALGNTYKSLGKNYKAIECYEKSLNIAKDIGDRAGEGHCYGNLGNTFSFLGEYHKAIEYINKSLSIAKDIGDRSSEGVSYQNLANTYVSLGECHKAIGYHEKSLAIAKEIGYKAVEGRSYIQLGEAFQKLGDFRKAIECHEKSLSIAQAIGVRADEGSSYGCLGNSYRAIGEYRKAIECHKMSLSIAKEIDDLHCESSAHHNIGACYISESSNKNLDKAEEHLKNSIECREKMFDDLKEKDQFKISFVDTYVKSYKVLSEVQLMTKQPEQALLTCERGRARALREVLSLKYKTETSGASTERKSLELEELKAIQSSSCDACILFYDLDRNKLTARFWVMSPQSNSIVFYDEKTEDEALAKIALYLTEDEIENIESGYFTYLVENSFHYLNVRAKMRCEDRSLESLRYEDQGKGVASKPTSKSTKTACNVFPELSRCIYMGEEDGTPLEMFFNRLVTPVLGKLNTEEIVIIPDGSLFMVPFAALQDPQTGNFLSETKRLRLAPSLTTLKILQESSDDRYYKSGALIIGDPAVGEVIYRGKKISDIHRLPGARDEAIAIGELLGVEPLIGEKATKEAVLGNLQHGVSVIHFAAHGSARNGEIMLAPSKPRSPGAPPEEEDYMLTMKEAQDSGVRAQLVVLSCCHSGRGDIKSEGVVGMTRAFLAAGARAVVASLWAIDDQATKFFMLKFYSHLKNGESASRSLQQAMKEMRETEKYKKPEYWAAFFLIGDDVTITV